MVGSIPMFWHDLAAFWLVNPAITGEFGPYQQRF
jgi:hypothetical protein